MTLVAGSSLLVYGERMAVLNIFLDDSPESRQSPEWLAAQARAEGKRVVQGKLVTIGALPGGMGSGAASIYIQVELEDGSIGFCETSLALFLAAAKAFEARYGSNPKGN